jgi:hypothetical protein
MPAPATAPQPLPSWTSAPLAQWNRFQISTDNHVYRFDTPVSAIPSWESVGGRNVITPGDLQPTFTAFSSLQDAIDGAHRLSDAHPLQAAYGVLHGAASDAYFAVPLGTLVDDHKPFRTIYANPAVIDGVEAGKLQVSDAEFKALTPDLLAVVSPDKVVTPTPQGS